MPSLSRRTMLSGGLALGGTALLGRKGGASPWLDESPQREVLTIGRGDVRYPSLTRGQNQRFTSTPESVLLPRSTADVVQVVHSGVCEGRKITVRSGGHCYEDFVDQPGVQAVVDMSDMNSVEFDTERNAVAVGAGATLGQVYSTLFRRWGVTLPGGACYSVGVGGHVTDGSYGHLSRSRHGGTRGTSSVTRNPSDFPTGVTGWTETSGTVCSPVAVHPPCPPTRTSHAAMAESTIPSRTAGETPSRASIDNPCRIVP